MSSSSNDIDFRFLNITWNDKLEIGLRIRYFAFCELIMAIFIRNADSYIVDIDHEILSLQVYDFIND